MGRSAKSSGEKEKELSFEEAVERLEKILEAMEREDLPLEELLRRYEEGVKLTRLCEARLRDAEARIQALTESAEGEARLEPLEEDGSESGSRETSQER
ncbi:MAG: exodeoxyribonuclease VII small subunit [Verrucomicrobia bacterium]|nr:exodeoxyribonuclease VII small subunit [Verrucomicrobiota bacterium]